MWRLFWVFNLLFAQVTLDQTTTVTLNGDYRPAEINFTGVANSRVDVTARSSAAEPIDVTLELLLDNQRLAFNDDHGTDRSDMGERDAHIEPFTLPADGEYTIRVNSFSGAQTGQVIVTVQVHSLFACPANSVQWFALAANERFLCSVQIKAGSKITVTARDVSSTLDPVLEVWHEAERVAYNDDHGTANAALNTLDAAIVDMIIDTEGEYIVYVSDFSGAAGAFELFIQLK